MNRTKKIFSFISLLLLVILLPVSAKAETWYGVGFINHNNIIDSSEKQYYINDDPITESTELTSLSMIGPSLDLAIYPSDNIPLGISISNQILFPIGYNNGKSYRSYENDLKNRDLISLNYAQMYSDYFGLFADLGFEFNYNRTAKKNIQNSKGQIEFHKYMNYGLYGDIGLLTKLSNGYFKLGFNYYHSLKNNAMSYDLLITGGFCF